MGLHTMDAPANENKSRSLQHLKLLPPPNNLTNMEERRRAFWAIFLLNTYTSLSTGWPAPIPLEEIQLRLPCLETEFQSSKECPAKYFTPHQNGRGLELTSGEDDIWALCVESCGILNRVCSWLQVEWDQRSPSDWKRRQMEGSKMADEFEEWWRRVPKTVTSLERPTENLTCAVLLHGIYHTYLFLMQCLSLVHCSCCTSQSHLPRLTLVPAGPRFPHP
jgi:hypothetical protein